ncbi:MAG: cobyric acid synthase [Nitrospirota bacterium]|nr:cobyric acid synthase [Nitrospirota bacterium]
MARAVMVCGTGSHAGKSLLVAALCRILWREGRSVAPFKAQNMSNNAAVADGGEIGRAQALQARAAGLSPSVLMNPILLKPEGEMRSQVVVRGEAVGSMDVQRYHRFKQEHAREVVRDTYRELASRHDVVVIEGAGSPAEINLKAHDIANLWMAGVADAPVLLVGDIDRGGVFAALAGTLELLEPHERARIAGFIINKFRGDATLLTPAIDMLRTRYGKPTLGVVPWIEHHLPEEDGLALPNRPIHHSGEEPGGRELRIGVVRLPRIANFSDFDPLIAEPDVALCYVDQPSQLADLDAILLPGSKATLSDLAWLRGRGLDAVLTAFAGRGGAVFGICGGYQMLGTHIADPDALEGGQTGASGLGLLPLSTRMARTKRCAAVTVTPAADAGFGNEPLEGYEIHLGVTAVHGGQPLFHGVPDGFSCRVGSVGGAYLHGLFDNDAARAAFLTPLRQRHGLPQPARISYRNLVDASLDHLADAVSKSLDMGAIHGLIDPS